MTTLARLESISFCSSPAQSFENKTFVTPITAAAAHQ